MSNFVNKITLLINNKLTPKALKIKITKKQR